MTRISALLPLAFCLMVCFQSKVAAKQEKVIESFHVKSDIRFRLATTQIESVVRNTADTAQEIFFDITLPKEAFITSFSMEIDGKIYNGEVKEKTEAKKTYIAAVERGDTAGHIKQAVRHANVFEVSVNVANGSAATFLLTYQEMLHRKLHAYQHEIHISPGQAVKDFLIEVFIQENKPLTFVKTPALQTGPLLTNRLYVDEKISAVDRPSPNTAYITYRPSLLDQGESGLAARFIVEYDVEHSLKGDVLVVDGYFVHFFAPDISPMPKDIVFILDVSGSMLGQKMQQMKDAMLVILGDLQPDDRFNIITFSSSVNKWESNFAKATPKTIETAQNFIKTIVAMGGTNINSALETGIQELKRIEDQQRVGLIFFLTDGQPTRGITEPPTIAANILERNGNTSAIFGLAFGRRADYGLLTTISNQNSGFARKIYQDSDAALQVASLYKEISAVSIKHLSFEYLPSSVDEYTVTDKKFPVVLTGTEVIVCGRLADNAEVFDMEMTGVQKSGPLNVILEIDNVTDLVIDADETANTFFTMPRDFSGIVEKMWAYVTIKQYLKEKEIYASNEAKVEELERKILQTAMKYKFVTPLTSMVVTKPESPMKPVESVLEDADDRQQNIWPRDDRLGSRYKSTKQIEHMTHFDGNYPSPNYGRQNFPSPDLDRQNYLYPDLGRRYFAPPDLGLYNFRYRDHRLDGLRQGLRGSRTQNQGLTSFPSPDQALSSFPPPDHGLRNFPPSDHAVSSFPPPDHGLSSFPLSDHAVSSFPPPDHGLSSFPPSDHAVSSFPPPDHGLSSFPPPDHGLSSFPPSDHAVSSFPPDHGLSSFPPSDHAVSSFPPDHGLSSFPPSDHGLSSFPPSDHGLSSFPPSDHAVSSFPPDHGLSSFPPSDHGLSSFPPSDHAVSSFPPDHGLSSFTPSDHGLSSFPPPDHGLSSFPPSDHGLSSFPLPDHGLSSFPPPDHGLSSFPPSDHGLSSFPPSDHAVSSFLPDHGLSSFPPLDHGLSSFPPSDHGLRNFPPPDHGLSSFPPDYAGNRLIPIDYDLTTAAVHVKKNKHKQGLRLSAITVNARHLRVCLVPRRMQEGTYELLRTPNGKISTLPRTKMKVELSCAGKNCKNFVIKRAVFENSGSRAMLSVDQNGEWEYQAGYNFNVTRTSSDSITIYGTEITVNIGTNKTRRNSCFMNINFPAIDEYNRLSGTELEVNISKTKKRHLSLARYDGFIGYILNMERKQTSKWRKAQSPAIYVEMPGVCSDQSSSALIYMKNKIMAPYKSVP